jgi:Bacterial extracellular solute-binding protein
MFCESIKEKTMTTSGITQLAALAALACTVLAAHARDLSVVSWGGAYQDGQKEVYFKPFNAAGTKLTDEAWDGGLGVLRTKIKGGANTWDVVQVEADELEVGCDEGLYEKLDAAKIGGASRYLPGTVHACGVGAIIYNLVLAYDGDKTKTAPAGWGDFFDTKKFPGKRSIRNGAKWNLEVALIAEREGQEEFQDGLERHAVHDGQLGHHERHAEQGRCREVDRVHGPPREPGEAAQVHPLRCHVGGGRAADRQVADGRAADQPRHPETSLPRGREVLDRQRRQARRALDQVVRHEVDLD